MSQQKQRPTDSTSYDFATDGAAGLVDVDHVGHQFDLTDRMTEQTTNPLRAGLRLERVPAPCVMVIFGVTGDLTARKLMPSLYDLAVGHPLPEGFSIVGVSHRDWDDETFRAEMRKAAEEGARAPVTDEAWDLFAQGIFYVRGDFDSDTVYTELKERLDHIDEERRAHGNRLFYLATSPKFYAPIIRHLGASGLAQRQDIYYNKPDSWNRIVVEKPFGRDIETARALNAEIGRVFSERQIYRIDHYSARRRSRTSSPSGSPTSSSSRSGTGSSSTTSRSPSPSRSASRAAAATTRTPARCATWSRATSCSCSP